jgi:hypothetical protein
MTPLANEVCSFPLPVETRLYLHDRLHCWHVLLLRVVLCVTEGTRLLLELVVIPWRPRR